jgi:hypothetical protein
MPVETSSNRDPPCWSVLLWQGAKSIVIEEVSIVATHSKTRRAVKRIRRLARRRREAELKKTRAQGAVNPR